MKTHFPLGRLQSDLGKQVNGAILSLQSSSELIQILQKEIMEKSVELSKLREEYERYCNLAMIKKGEVIALIKQLEIAAGGKQWQERFFAIIVDFSVGLIFFCRWVVASYITMK